MLKADLWPGCRVGIAAERLPSTGVPVSVALGGWPDSGRPLRHDRHHAVDVVGVQRVDLDREHLAEVTHLLHVPREGADPEAPLLQAADGNFYGTTKTGGVSNAGFGGDGVIFRMDPAGNVTTLHPFTRADGRNPTAGLVQAADGTFYGTTSLGDGTTNTGVLVPP